MGNQQNTQQIYAKYVGPEKVKGESRVLRSAILAENQECFKEFRGMSNLKQIIEKNVQDSPKNPYLALDSGLKTQRPRRPVMACTNGRPISKCMMTVWLSPSIFNITSWHLRLKMTRELLGLCLCTQRTEKSG